MSPAQPGRFRLFPIPGYSRTTAGGTRVSCGGCCLALPIGCLTGLIAVAAPVAVNVVRRRRSRS
ncbi:hypothetical protein LQK93_00934 [Terrabacter sp. BE26]